VKNEKMTTISVAVLEQMQKSIAELSHQLAAVNKELELVKAENVALKIENAQLRERVKDLEERLGRDSHNSSKPPSSDGFKKPNKNRSLRGKSGKKPGGQPGHQGHGLSLPHNPDKTVRCTPKKCETGLSNSVCHGVVVDRKYVIDEVREVIVTEYDKMQFNCPLEKRGFLYGEFPEGLTGVIQYGDDIKAEVIMPETGGGLPSQAITGFRYRAIR
jgi:regulator of replication initiation timing